MTRLQLIENMPLTLTIAWVTPRNVSRRLLGVGWYNDVPSGRW